MKRKIILAFAVFVLTVGVTAYFKTQAGNNENTEGVVWSGSEDNDADLDPTNNINGTDSTISGSTGTVDGNEGGIGWLNLNCNSKVEDTSIPPDGVPDDPLKICNLGANRLRACNGPDAVACPGGTCSDACTVLGALSYGVNIPVTSAGVLYGYAWSENYGYVTFNELDLQGCPNSSLPATDPLYNKLCRAERIGANLQGWARILDIKQAAAAGNSGGWQGWIRLSGTGNLNGLGNCSGTNDFGNSNKCNYGIKIVPSSEVDYEDLDGYAWSDELGWIKMKGSKYKGKLRVGAKLIICPDANPTIVEVGIPRYLDAHFSTGGDIKCSDITAPLPGFISKVTNSPNTTWISGDITKVDANDTGVKGQILGKIPGASTDVTVEYVDSFGTLNKSLAIIVSVMNPGPTGCFCDPSLADSTCKGKTYKDNCNNSVCAGTRDCSAKWVETEP